MFLEKKTSPKHPKIQRFQALLCKHLIFLKKKQAKFREEEQKAEKKEELISEESTKTKQVFILYRKIGKKWFSFRKIIANAGNVQGKQDY